MSLADRNGGGENIRPRLFDAFVMSNFNSNSFACLTRGAAAYSGQRTKRTKNDIRVKK